jgi:hypothetical protein
MWRVEVEFLSGPEDLKDRRLFARATTVEFVQDSYLRVVSVDDGEILVKFDRLQWYHSQPLNQFEGTSVPTVEQRVLDAMKDAAGGFNNKISGIKKYRELTNHGLKEAHAYVEDLFNRMTPF